MGVLQRHQLLNTFLHLRSVSFSHQLLREQKQSPTPERLISLFFCLRIVDVLVQVTVKLCNRQTIPWNGVFQHAWLKCLFRAVHTLF